jgi:hypothetical protein
MLNWLNKWDGSAPKFSGYGLYDVALVPDVPRVLEAHPLSSHMGTGDCFPDVNTTYST